jgi:hypothetical protein
MTDDLIATRRQYRAVYTNWPVSVIEAHMILIDCKVANMHPDEMIEARQLMDERLPLWR